MQYIVFAAWGLSVKTLQAAGNYMKHIINENQEKIMDTWQW